MSDRDDLLEQGPREAPEPETAEARTRRAGLKTVGLVVLFLLLIASWVFNRYAFYRGWGLTQQGGWIGGTSLVVGAILWLAFRLRGRG